MNGNFVPERIFVREGYGRRTEERGGKAAVSMKLAEVVNVYVTPQYFRWRQLEEQGIERIAISLF